MKTHQISVIALTIAALAGCITVGEQVVAQANAAYEEGHLAYLELLDARQDALLVKQDYLITRNSDLNTQVSVNSELSGRWSQALHEVPVI